MVIEKAEWLRPGRDLWDLTTPILYLAETRKYSSSEAVKRLLRSNPEKNRYKLRDLIRNLKTVGLIVENSVMRLTKDGERALSYKEGENYDQDAFNKLVLRMLAEVSKPFEQFIKFLNEIFSEKGATTLSQRKIMEDYIGRYKYMFSPMPNSHKVDPFIGVALSTGILKEIKKGSYWYDRDQTASYGLVQARAARERWNFIEFLDATLECYEQMTGKKESLVRGKKLMQCVLRKLPDVKDAEDEFEILLDDLISHNRHLVDERPLRSDTGYRFKSTDMQAYNPPRR